MSSIKFDEELSAVAEVDAEFTYVIENSNMQNVDDVLDALEELRNYVISWCSLQKECKVLNIGAKFTSV